MWIASKWGFYSIVRKPDGIHVRARIREDLERLLAASGRGVSIQEWPVADYRWRVVVSPAELAVLMQTLADGVDYPNFKAVVAGRPDQRAKLGAYHELWTELYLLQADATGPRRPAAPSG